MTNENLIRAINSFGVSVVSAIATQLKLDGSEASGILIKSLNYKLVEVIKEINFRLEVWAEDYFKFVNDGRKKGKQPPLEKIKQWTKLKGIPEKAAFPIARKIGLFGIPPRQTLKKALQDDSVSLDVFEKVLQDAAKKDIESQIEQMIKDVKTQR